MKACCYAICLIALITSAFADVTVSTPWNGSVVASPVQYVASAVSKTCDKGVSSMGIYVNGKLVYVVNGAKLNTELKLDPANYKTIVEEWDYCGGATYTPVAITVTNKTGVWVMTPANNAKVSSPVHYQATATTFACSKGVASMGIYVNNQLKYVVDGASLDTNLSLASGTYNTVVEEWDRCGGAAYTPIKITVGSGGGNVFYNLQGSGGWDGYGELPPQYQICKDCGPGVTWSMTQHIQSPSMSGNSTRFSLGGTTPYSDVLFNNHLIGQGSSQGMPDTNHTLLPTLHNFTYDAYFYTDQLSLSEALEFDINMFFNGVGLIWGTQCTVAAGHEWEIWDNVNSKWVSTGNSCYPVNNGWNHVVIQVQRESDNTLRYQSITLNGTKNVLNKYYAPGSAPQGWWGITVNYQMDGNYQQADYSTYLDNFSFYY